MKVRFLSLLLVTLTFLPLHVVAEKLQTAYDFEMAKEICDNLPLENVEGIWLYPDDKVKVLILSDDDNKINSFPTYTISVVETADARLHPGDILGKLTATPDANLFKIELVTEKKNNILLKPTTCLASLGKEGDTFTFRKGRTGIKGRLNINLNRLLPGFWKIISTGVSTTTGNTNPTAPVGMVKLYPSYDGNGSSRRKIRYL